MSELVGGRPSSRVRPGFCSEISWPSAATTDENGVGVWLCSFLLGVLEPASELAIKLELPPDPGVRERGF